MYNSMTCLKNPTLLASVGHSYMSLLRLLLLSNKAAAAPQLLLHSQLTGKKNDSLPEEQLGLTAAWPNSSSSSSSMALLSRFVVGEEGELQRTERGC